MKRTSIFTVLLVTAFICVPLSVFALPIDLNSGLRSFPQIGSAGISLDNETSSTVEDIGSTTIGPGFDAHLFTATSETSGASTAMIYQLVFKADPSLLNTPNQANFTSIFGVTDLRLVIEFDEQPITLNTGESVFYGLSQYPNDIPAQNIEAGDALGTVFPGHWGGEYRNVPGDPYVTTPDSGAVWDDSLQVAPGLNVAALSFNLPEIWQEDPRGAFNGIYASVPIIVLASANQQGRAALYDGAPDPSTRVATFTASVPEPATMLLLGMGLVGMAGLGRRKLKLRT